ncbi:hemerythrin superfamily protein/carbon monoxide dehydrogenase subunit G [Catenulispora sp. GP43]|uniref:SRPBCC family protein n=1 Tax=Catenulispora sp. GP43 TaxID=3156263 RepID=UPI003513A110
MSDVTESVDVNVPVSTAYNQWTQFESFPLFMAGVESVTQIDELHTRWVTSVGGARREFDAEITEQHPDERIAWKSIGGDTSHAGVVTFHRLAADQTRVTVQLVWDPQGFVEKAGSLLNLDAHQVKADTERFKKFIEEQGDATGQYRGDQPAPGDRGAVQGGDIVEVLLSQHEEVKRGFTRLQAASGEDRVRLFAELAALLHAHETGEQQVVHPVIREDASGGRQIAADRVEEEQTADQVLAELKALGVDHPDFGARLDVFHQVVLAHATAEEEQEFPRLNQLPPHRRQELAEQLRAVQNTPIPK